MQTFFSHKTAQGRFVLDGVVTVVRSLIVVHLGRSICHVISDQGD